MTFLHRLLSRYYQIKSNQATRLLRKDMEYWSRSHAYQRDEIERLQRKARIFAQKATQKRVRLSSNGNPTEVGHRGFVA